ncbi:MAG: NAD(P)-dependent dehydrogenase (short-subunit alcohol dehydrogenase family) [Verrucomicrobiales bacterium]|jgi:NAD(P)-dependent dehydrogenase (short-subunit alcohol dehydrogenase family)
MNKIAIVTGGGSGIGRAAAHALDAAGWNVVIAGRGQEALDQTLTDLVNDGLAVACDVSKPDDVERLFASTEERFGGVDLLFNNAGVAARGVPIDELEVDEWERVISINLTGSFLCARAAFSLMRRQDPHGGRIINNGSISATTPRPFSAPYTASKHAITGLTKSLSLDGREFGIAVGQIDIGNAASRLVEKMKSGILQPNGDVAVEPTMSLDHAANAVVHMASLPHDANVLFMTVMANDMPFVGRG